MSAGGTGEQSKGGGRRAAGSAHSALHQKQTPPLLTWGWPRGCPRGPATGSPASFLLVLVVSAERLLCVVQERGGTGAVLALPRCAMHAAQRAAQQRRRRRRDRAARLLKPWLQPPSLQQACLCRILISLPTHLAGLHRAVFRGLNEETGAAKRPRALLLLAVCCFRCCEQTLLPESSSWWLLCYEAYAEVVLVGGSVVMALGRCSSGRSPAAAAAALATLHTAQRHASLSRAHRHCVHGCT